MSRDWKVFIDDIFDSILKIEKYMTNKTFIEFQKDEMMYDAVIRNFEIMGEAANHVPFEIQEKYKFVEWSEMVGMRNILIHNYFGVDSETLWKTINKNIPVLKKHIIQLKEQEGF